MKIKCACGTMIIPSKGAVRIECRCGRVYIAKIMKKVIYVEEK